MSIITCKGAFFSWNALWHILHHLLSISQMQFYHNSLTRIKCILFISLLLLLLFIIIVVMIIINIINIRWLLGIVINIIITASVIFSIIAAAEIGTFKSSVRGIDIYYCSLIRWGLHRIAAWGNPCEATRRDMVYSCTSRETIRRLIRNGNCMILMLQTREPLLQTSSGLTPTCTCL